MSINIGIYGANGKMGITTSEVLATNQNQFNLVGKIISSSSTEELRNCCKQSDVIIDFSIPSALEALLTQAVLTKTRLIIGTTGYNEEHLALIKNASNKIAILYAQNTSLGANLLSIFASKAAKILKGYDIEILDTHHKHKKDAPSGTALMIAEEIADNCNLDLKKIAVFNRAKKGKRSDGEIGFSSIRGGGIFGKHDIIFAGQNEMITLEHQALSKGAFAEGAIVAANWIVDKKPGFYSMKNLLGLE